MMDSSQSSTGPTNLIVIGMAGAGKTTFVHKLIEHLNSNKKSHYCVNLDPAVNHVPYNCNVDIRDTVKFKEVMKQYGFGPNGAIMTSLNFFTSKFNSMVDILKQHEGKHEYIIFDTPGQIEVFTWSASGIIITEALSNLYPTVIVYVIDTARCHNPTTFMSNMLYACSITYRMRLPLLCVFNKTDVLDCSFALEWMKDFEKFQEALALQRGHSSNLNIPEMEDIPIHSDSSPYLTSLTNSMSLVLDEFYSEIQACGVSSLDGIGFDQLMDKFSECRKDFVENFVSERKTEETNKKRKTLLDLNSESSSNSDEEDEQIIMQSEAKHKPWINDGSQTLKQYVASEISMKRDNKSKSTMLIDLGGTSDAAEMDVMVQVDSGTELKPYELTEEDDSESIRVASSFQSKLTLTTKH